MKEFKGTKGKWKKTVNRNGDMEISGKGFDLLAIVNLYPEGYWEKHIKNKITVSPEPDIQKKYRDQCIYNALLISKAPELLMNIQMHIDSLDLTNIEFYEKYGFNVSELMPRSRKLIKETTEL